MRRPAPTLIDPFDLPETLGTGQVVWCADDGLGGASVRGALWPDPGEPVACDLLAVDEAYPRPVADETLRATAHQAWRHGEVHLVAYDDRLTLLVPGSVFDAARVLDAVARLAKALGASSSSWSVRLRLG